jgi:hypothetical protein
MIPRFPGSAQTALPFTGVNIQSTSKALRATRKAFIFHNPYNALGTAAAGSEVEKTASRTSAACRTGGGSTAATAASARLYLRNKHGCRKSRHNHQITNTFHNSILLLINSHWFARFDLDNLQNRIVLSLLPLERLVSLSPLHHLANLCSCNRYGGRESRIHHSYIP